jgi:hypothetical protein
MSCQAKRLGMLVSGAALAIEYTVQCICRYNTYSRIFFMKFSMLQIYIFYACSTWSHLHECSAHRLNMELDLHSLFGLHVCAHSLAETPQHPLPPRLGSYTRALLVSQDGHLFATPNF